MSEYEVTLGIAQTLSGSIQTLQNLPGSVSYLLDKTAEKYQADYVLVDLNPSLSSINQNILMTSDYFIVPTSPDYFSVMAIDSLAKVLPRWHEWAMAEFNSPVLKTATYPFPECKLRFLGTVIQKYRPRSGGPAQAFQTWIDEIELTVGTKLLPILNQSNMLLPSSDYESNGVNDSYTITTIPDFNSLIAMSQDHQAPVFELTDEQIGLKGIVLDRTLKQQGEFKATISRFADQIIGLTS